MRYIILLLVLLFSAQASYADGYEQARNAGKEIGQAGSSKSSQILNGGLDQKLPGDITVRDALNFQGTDIAESKLSHIDLEAESKRRFLDPNNEHVKLIKSADDNLDAVELNTNNTKFDRAKDAQKNPENYIDWLTSKYSDCTNTGGEEVNYENYKVCDIYHGISENTCKIGKLVEVAAKHSYECVKERNTYNKNCKKSLKVWCERKPDCDSGGIIKDSVTADMVWDYNYPNLIWGQDTGKANYWYGHCETFDRKVTFTIKNLKDIDEFRIYQVGYDDYIRVVLNGVQVLNRPNDGDWLEVVENKRSVITSKKELDVIGRRGLPRTYSCELSISRDESHNVDLKPYLKEGLNTMEMRVVVYGSGKGNLKIKTKQHCCIEKQGWEEKCD